MLSQSYDALKIFVCFWFQSHDKFCWYRLMTNFSFCRSHSSGRSRAKSWIGQEISFCSRGPFGICWFYFNRLFKNCNLDTRQKQFIIIHLPHKHANLALACQEGVAVRIAGGVVHLAHADRPITQVIAALLVNISDESSDYNFDPSMFLCLSMKM